MNKFIKVKIREKVEGQPGFAKPNEFEVRINPGQITLFNKGEDNGDITFVRLSCGITLCVMMKEEKFAKLMDSIKD